jgi:NAD(P)-dependent dehydrogenase (short-subunit alcohol dehydrogenase family)
MSFEARLSLAGRSALVTGAAAGIGRATAETLAARGASPVWLVDTDAPGLAEVAAGIPGSRTVAVDVTDADGLAHALGDTPVDLLVNAAGNTASATFLDVTLEEWQATLDSHATGCFVTCRLLAPGMVERRYGRIVNVSSVAGKRGGGFLGKTAYASAKATINGLTKAIAREVAPSGVRVNSVNPGLTDTRRLDALRADPEVWARCLAAVPLGREARPEEVATVILWLLSDASAYVTGETLNVDGGVAME